MFKFICSIVLLSISFTCNAFQTKQEIIDYCKRIMLRDGGNQLVLLCIEQELQAQEEIKKLSK